MLAFDCVAVPGAIFDVAALKRHAVRIKIDARYLRLFEDAASALDSNVPAVLPAGPPPMINTSKKFRHNPVCGSVIYKSNFLRMRLGV